MKKDKNKKKKVNALKLKKKKGYSSGAMHKRLVLSVCDDVRYCCSRHYHCLQRALLSVWHCTLI